MCEGFLYLNLLEYFNKQKSKIHKVVYISERKKQKKGKQMWRIEMTSQLTDLTGMAIFNNMVYKCNGSCHSVQGEFILV